MHASMSSHFSHVRFFVTVGTVANWAPLSMGIARQEYWSGLSGPPPEELPNPGIKPMTPSSPALQVDSLQLTHQGDVLCILPQM